MRESLLRQSESEQAGHRRQPEDGRRPGDHPPPGDGCRCAGREFPSGRDEKTGPGFRVPAACSPTRPPPTSGRANCLPGLDDPRFQTSQERRAYRDEINGRIAARIRTRGREEWIEILNRDGVPCGPINTLREAFADPQVLHHEMVLESDQPSGKVKMPGFAVKLTGTPARLRRPSPQLGEHTAEILQGIGYREAEVETFIARGVVITRGGGA